MVRLVNKGKRQMIGRGYQADPCKPKRICMLLRKKDAARLRGSSTARLARSAIHITSS